MKNETVQDLRDFLVTGRNELLAQKPASEPAPAWLEKHTQLIDETLRRIYHAAWRTARGAMGLPEEAPDGASYSAQTGEHEPELALLAIGGYGRAELCPHSDI
ncbi:MAG TPA: hypothetical protein VF719_02980, partial [Abditibacteriaceae bacterium]